jgi:outer membrane protein
MKKASLILNIVLTVGLVTLYVLFFTNKQPVSDKMSGSAKEIVAFNGEVLPIAYVNLDSLLLKYEFAKRENEKLMNKQESSRLKLTQEGKKFEADYMDFQRKVENNVYATRERAESEAARLARKQEELQGLELKLSEELMLEQEKINLQLRDSVNTALALFNQDRNYQLILSNTMNDNILIANESFDITNEFVDLLNSRMKK